MLVVFAFFVLDVLFELLEDHLLRNQGKLLSLHLTLGLCQFLLELNQVQVVSFVFLLRYEDALNKRIKDFFRFLV